MSLLNKMELSVVIAFVTGMLVWGVSPCELGMCMVRLPYWLMIWWGAVGAASLYLLWRKWL